MSVLSSVVCLDCLEEYHTRHGANIIGYPSLSKEKKPVYSKYERGSIGQQNNFGYLYEGIKTLKMHTYNVLAYVAFLNKHECHRIHLFCEAEDIFPPEIPEDLDDIDSFKYENNELVEAFYEIHCDTCNVTTRLDHTKPVIISKFDQFNISVEEQMYIVNHMLSGDFITDSYENYANAFDLLPFEENIDNLYLFFYQHYGHKLISRLSTENNQSSSITTDDMKKVLGFTKNELIDVISKHRINLNK